MPSLTARVFNGGGDDHTGDAHVISEGPLNDFNPIQTLGWVGRGAKNQDEVNVFMAFDTSAIALGSRIDGVNLQFTTSIAADGEGGVRVGMLVQDGTWEVNGFAALGSSPVPRYDNAFRFPNDNDGTDIPHATQDSSLTIEPGILVFNNWAVGADIPFNAFTFPADTVRVWGDGIGGEDHILDAILPIFNIAVNVGVPQTVVAFTIDSQAVANELNRLNLYLTETANDDDRPRLTVEWTLNPPDFTIFPPPTAIVGLLYSKAGFAVTYVLGDQTFGNFVDNVYTLEGTEGTDFPTGMTIISNPTTGFQLNWTPTVAQIGLNSVHVRVTNPGLLTDDLIFNIDVNKRLEGDVVAAPVDGLATTATAEPHSVSAAAEPHAVTATPEPHAVKATTQGGLLSVTFVEPGLTIEED